MIDVTEQVSTVRREVGGRVLEAGRAQVVTVSRSYPAELADVWDACTNPERKEKGETARIPPLSIYSAPGGLPQDSGRAAE